jgi:hypothetical protein
MSESVKQDGDPRGWFRRRRDKTQLKKQRYAERKAAAHPGAPDRWSNVGKGPTGPGQTGPGGM